MTDYLACHDTTVSGRPCRRRGAWLVLEFDGAFRCKQHAAWQAARAGGSCQVQHIGGRIEDVTDVVVDELVAALNAARDYAAFARARSAIAARIRACQDPRQGLKHELRAAMNAARTRLGMEVPQ